MPIETNDASLTDVSWSSGLKIWVRTTGGALRDMVLGSAAARNVGTSSGQIPTLNADGKLDAGVLPTVSADVSSAVPLAGGTMTGALMFSGTDYAGVAHISLTTEERDAIATPAAGSQIYNETTGQVEAYEGAAWRSLRSDLANADDGYGVALIRYFNDNDYFASATNLFDILEYVGEYGIFQDDVGFPTEVTTLAAGDGLAVFGAEGSMKSIDASVALGTGSNNILTITDDYTITADDFRRILDVTAGSDVSITLQTQADEPVDSGFYFDFIQSGAGVPTVVCDDSAIILNLGANGVAAPDAQGNAVRVINRGPDKWFAGEIPAATTTDSTNPALVSVSPAIGSTILADQIIQFTFTENIVVGTGNIVQREDTGGGFGDDETVDVTDPLGTSAGEINIVDNVLTFNPAGARTAGADYAYRIATTALDDTSGNSYAGITNDTTVYFSVAGASSGSIEVVSSGSGYVDSGSAIGGAATQAKTISSPSNGDMTIGFASSIAAIGGGLPATLTAISDNTANTNPGCFAAYRVEGGSPSNSITFKTVSNRRQAWGYLVVRGTGGTLGIDNVATKNNGAPVEAADAPALVQNVDGALRVAAYFIDTVDLTPTYAALTSAGWAVPIVQNTQQSSSSVGATLLVAVKAAGGAATDSVDPPAISSGVVVYRATQFTIKET